MNGARSGVEILRRVLSGLILAGTVLASIFSSPAIAENAPVPEDSAELLTLVDRGMTKSRSGAT